MKTKVLMVLSKEFNNDPRVNKEALSLVKEGFHVTVLCWDRQGSFPSEEQMGNINIIRLKNSWFMRNLPHDLLRNPAWWWHAYIKAIAMYHEDFDFDVVHCHDLDTLVTGVLLKRKLGVKLVYDAHEIFGHMVARDIPSLVARFVFLLEKILVNYIDRLIIAEENYKSYFQSITDAEITAVLNCKDLIVDRYQKPKTDTFTLVYIGVLNKSRFFPDLMEAVATIDHVELKIAGKKENMYELVKNLSEHYENIEFLGTIPYSSVLDQTIAADAVLCMINPKDINNRIATANKQFEAMVCGRPIICTKGTRSGEITENMDCGLVVEYTKKALQQAIITLRDSSDLCERLGRNALKAAKKKYNWGNEERKLIALYKKF